MGNLSTLVPQQESPVVSAIYAWHKKMGDSEPERGYLGASIIGRECDRFLWYTFRGCVKRNFDGRMYRLFETGQLAEARFVKELRAIGCTVHEVGPDGKQFAVSAVGGHFSGHMDGCACGIPEAEKTWHVLEFKTHNCKSFDKLISEGVAESKPEHLAQMQVYMGLSKMDRALYLAVNKDTDELYAERIKYDSTALKQIMDRAERIIRAQAPPERIANRLDDFRCRFCDARELCWGISTTVAVPLPGKTCRTCCHATPEMDGDARWSCALDRTGFIPVQKGCQHHLLLPGLISFAVPVDAGDDWIEFENTADKARWRHGNGSGDTWTTEELIAAGRGPLDGAKVCPIADPPGTPPPTIPHAYPWGGSELVWHGTPDGIEAALVKHGLSELLTGVSERTEDTADYHACEFAEQGIAIVVYFKDNQAAIWRGKT